MWHCVGKAVGVQVWPGKAVGRQVLLQVVLSGGMWVETPIGREHGGDAEGQHRSYGTPRRGFARVEGA